MLGYVMGKPKKKDDPASWELLMPPDLRRRLAEWIDVDEVGADGFWLWFRAVLPLLPAREVSKVRGPSVGGSPPDRMRELARDLVDCARERARLTVIAEQYFRENQVLARRLKALEAVMRTFERAGHTVVVPPDDAAGIASERYLPRR
jgi:hypothetical protein